MVFSSFSHPPTSTMVSAQAVSQSASTTRNAAFQTISQRPDQRHCSAVGQCGLVFLHHEHEVSTDLKRTSQKRRGATCTLRSCNKFFTES
jgi:hypothetical protein